MNLKTECVAPVVKLGQKKRRVRIVKTNSIVSIGGKVLTRKVKMIEYGTGDNPATDANGVTWINVAFFVGDKGTGDKRGIRRPDGTIEEID